MGYQVIMKSLLKSIVVFQDPICFALLKSAYSFMEGSDKEYDGIFKYIEEFHKDSNGQIPGPDALIHTLSISSEGGLVARFKEWMDDSTIPIFDKPDLFYASLLTDRQILFDRRLQHCLQQISASSQQSGSESERSESVMKSVSNLTELVSSLRNAEDRETTFIWGDDAVEEFYEDYGDVLDSKNNDDVLYADLGFKEFEEVMLKKGDMVTVAGFTSQGKSVWLRQLSYHMATKYGYHVGFFTLEMSAKVVRRLFWLLHANNRKLFPSAPRILYDDLKRGILQMTRSGIWER